MPAKKKVTDEQIMSAYKELGNVWKVGERLGICGQSVHERLVKLGENVPVNVFTDAEKKILEEKYVPYRNAGMLDVLADEMGRTKQFICRQAGRLGLTDKHNERVYNAVWKDADLGFLEPIWKDFKRSRQGLNAYCKAKHYGSVGFAKAMRSAFPHEYDDVIEAKTPKRTAYRVGRDFEYRTRDDLAKRGYLVMRSPGSKGPADLIAIKSGELLFIQCKLHGALPVGEWNAFIDYCARVSATPVMAEVGASNRGVRYWRLLGKKDGSKSKQPMEPFTPTNGIYRRPDWGDR